MSKAPGPTQPQDTYVPTPSAPQCYQETTDSVTPFSSFTPIVQPATKTTILPNERADETLMICPTCNAQIKPTTHTKPRMIAYVSATVIALMGCVLGCCFIPFCIDECVDVHHTCPNCKSRINL